MVNFNPIQFILHIDEYLGYFISNYGILTYFILFAIIFLETGLVIAPFLPGDSLLFISGVFAAQGFLNIALLFVIFTTAAILGDSLNYSIGKYFGERIFVNNRFFKKEYIQKTKSFYEKHGGKTIIYARFIPIIRTVAPFVAGVGKMNYSKFLFFNILGGIIWVFFFLLTGYFFGNIPIVKDNLSWMIYLIILVSLTPLFVEWIRHKLK